MAFTNVHIATPKKSYIINIFSLIMHVLTKIFTMETYWLISQIFTGLLSV